MGYTTKFTGELLFTKELTASQLAMINLFFGEDCRDHPEWECDGTYIDLELNDDFTGIRWDSDTEKNYGMVDHINLIIRMMKEAVPEFGLTGEMLAQGEDISDRWKLAIQDGQAVRVDLPETGKMVTCPHCNEDFILENEG